MFMITVNEMSNANISLTPEILQQIITNAVTAATTAAIGQRSQAGSLPAEKPKRPTLSPETTAEKWAYFLARWARYKLLTGITGTALGSHLMECCDEDLQLSLYRGVGKSITDKNEEEVLAYIKKYAVEDENILISRTIF